MRDMQRARKLVQKLGNEAQKTEGTNANAHYLQLADEALEVVLGLARRHKQNSAAGQAVRKLCQETTGRQSAMWNHVLRLIEDYASGRRS